jgi:hypothetical protein
MGGGLSKADADSYYQHKGVYTTVDQVANMLNNYQPKGDYVELGGIIDYLHNYYQPKGDYVNSQTKINEIFKQISPNVILMSKSQIQGETFVDPECIGRGRGYAINIIAGPIDVINKLMTIDLTTVTRDDEKMFRNYAYLVAKTDIQIPQYDVYSGGSTRTEEVIAIVNETRREEIPRNSQEYRNIIRDIYNYNPLLLTTNCFEPKY